MTEPMPRVANVRHLGIRPGDPLPPGHVYVGRRNDHWKLPESPLANRPLRRKADPYELESSLARYFYWLTADPGLVEAALACEGRVLVCWCAPPEGLPVHGPPWRCHAQVIGWVVDGARQRREASP